MAGAREWLDLNLFRPGPAPPPLTPRRFAAGVGLALAGVAVVLARLGWGTALDSLWAEDGRDFLRDALNHSLVDSVLTNFGGYLQVLPRLLAKPASWVSIELAPAALAIGPAAVTVLSAFIVWWTSSGHLRDPWLRGLLAALVVLTPVIGFESLASVSYLWWVTLFPAFWLLLWRPASLGRALAGACFLALALASAPLGLLLAPLAALRVLAVRNGRDIALVGGFAVGAVAQLVAIAGDDTPQYVESGFGIDLFALYSMRVIGGAALGPGGAALWPSFGWLAAALFAAALVALVVFVARRPGPERALSLIVVALSVVAFFVPGYQRDLAQNMIATLDVGDSTGARYTMFPALLLITVVLLQLERRPSVVSERAYERLRIATVAAIAVVALSAFYVGSPTRGMPRWSDELPHARELCSVGDRAEVDVPISPTGWVTTVPCRDL